jgi:tRNA pseudouridine55 synthase
MKRQQGGPEGVLLIDKPAGWTSHDVVAKVRRIAGQRRIGHTGTLDPAATGLLVLCLGRATRLVEYMAGHGKAYEGIIQLGARTATDDAEGEVLERGDVPHIDAATLAGLEDAYLGAQQQLPPAFSAIKIGGRKAYDMARRGDLVDLPLRDIRIDTLALSHLDGDRLAVNVECSAGTYIRALARDIGEDLGCGAHLASLRRTRVAKMDVGDAWTLPELEEAVTALGIDNVLLPVDAGVEDLDAALVASGEPHALSGPADRLAGVARLYDAAGAFLGVGTAGPGVAFRPLKLFIPPA